MSAKKLPTLARPHKEVPGETAAEPRLLAMVTALTSELAVTRERLDTLERLVEASGVIEQADVESFEPTPEQAQERQVLRKRIIEKAFRPLRESAERDARSAAGQRQTETAGKE